MIAAVQPIPMPLRSPVWIEAEVVDAVLVDEAAAPRPSPLGAAGLYDGSGRLEAAAGARCGRLVSVLA